MPKKLEDFKKQFNSLENKALEHIRTFTQFETSNNTARSFILEGAAELGLIVQKLKDNGASGTELKDFIGDNEVKAAVAEIDAMVNRRESELAKILQLKTKSEAVISAAGKLKTELQAEIASRKKQLTTKLGIGNKSLPGMIAELEKLAKAQSSGAFDELDTALQALDGPGAWKSERDTAIKNALAKTRTAAITDQQRAMLKQLLDRRNVNTVLTRARKLGEDFAAAAKLAKAGKEFNRPPDLKKGKSLALGKALLLARTVDPFEHGINDSFVGKRVKETGADVPRLVAEMIGIRDAVARESANIAKL